MTSVTMVENDSAALHTSKKTDNRNVKEVQAYPTAQAVQEHEDVVQAPRKNPQHSQQRRKHERRHENTPVLLDTRSGHDRRNVVDSQNAEADEKDKKNTGVNIYT